jgi:hypothetical protein
MIIKNLQNNKGPAPYEAEGSRSGFVILFAVTLSAILLAIALGVANIALKEVKFGTSAKDTGDAFFAADTASEYAFFNDKPPASLCTPAPGGTCSTSFVISGLGSNAQSCAIVSVTKDNTDVSKPADIKTSIVAKGYNMGDVTCTSSNRDRIEREIRTNY